MFRIHPSHLVSNIILSNLLVSPAIPSSSGDQICAWKNWSPDAKKLPSRHTSILHLMGMSSYRRSWVLNTPWSGASACSSFTISNDHPSLITEHPYLAKQLLWPMAISTYFNIFDSYFHHLVFLGLVSKQISKQKSNHPCLHIGDIRSFQKKLCRLWEMFRQ